MKKNQNQITKKTIESFKNTKNPRLKNIMSSLISHLHAFAEDVSLTEEEWSQAIKFLTATGHTCTDKRQEFILLSDVLGLSMLIVDLHKNKSAEYTRSTVLGPFYIDKTPNYESGDDISNGAKGKPCTVSGLIQSSNGHPIPSAKIEVWQADDEGEYDVQRPEIDHFQARGTLYSNQNGEYHFRTIVAEPYPIPTDGPVGKLLTATNRSAWRPAHLHFKIQAEGHETLVTHIFRKYDPYLQEDPVFGVKESLVADWLPQTDGITQLNFNFTLHSIK